MNRYFLSALLSFLTIMSMANTCHGCYADGMYDPAPKKEKVEDPDVTPGSTGYIRYRNSDGRMKEYVTVRCHDGRIWLQQNLGSDNVAASLDDSNAYGSLYQWGRTSDKHEQRTSDVKNSAQSYSPNSIPKSYSQYFLISSRKNTIWWNNGKITDSWSAEDEASVTDVNGQDPCASLGKSWYLPSYAEWMNVIAKEKIKNIHSAFSSNLKIPAGGHRNGINGNLHQVGKIAYYWTSTAAEYIDPKDANLNGAGAHSVWFWDNKTTLYKRDRRANGYSVRCIKRQDTKTVEVPGKVISYSPAPTNVFISGPSIELLSSGRIVASHDLSGPKDSYARENGNAVTRIFASDDGGLSWKYLTYFQMHMATLFEKDGVLYAIGINPQDIVINKSEDGGETWSGNYTLFEGRYHTASTPVVLAGNRIWKAVEKMNDAKWGQNFESMMISAPVDADLTDSASWVATNSLPFDASYLNGKFGGWLEGNAVVANDGTVKNILRVHTELKDVEYAAIQDVSEDGKVLSFDSLNGFKDFPGGSKKFFIRYDKTTRKYITLANIVTPEYNGLDRTSKIRNTLALCVSDDLEKWDVLKVILQTEKYKTESFQYVSWQFDGDDIIAVSRTSYDDAFGGAKNFHDANYFTFHRLSDYRKIVMGSDK